MKFINMARKGVLVAVLAVASTASQAAIDTTAVVAEIGGGTAAVQAIGAAALVVLAGAAVFKYVRRAL